MQYRTHLNYHSWYESYQQKSCWLQVVSDKVLVKQLQKEVARLEAELRVPESNEACSSDALLHAKDLQIQQVGWFCPHLHS